MSAEEMAVVSDPRIGQMIHERYRILRKLGEGGMGAVYEGEHVVISRRVAIKCLHPQFAANPEMVARFRREAMAANTTRHPNIVEVTDMGRLDDGGVFMILEFLEGRDLGALLDEVRTLPLARTVHILSQVCDALSAAHARNIVHRDLKPENIYLTTHGDDGDFVKVLDFGIAKFAETAAVGKITRAGTTVGTPHYMSPEQCFGETELDHRADIYSLGVVLFKCVTGALPFDDDSYPRLLMKVVDQPPPRLSELAPGVPPELELFVERLLAKDPSARPQSCREVKTALAAFKNAAVSAIVPSVDARADTLPPATPLSQAPPAVPTRSIGKWIALAAALAIAAIAAIAGIAVIAWPREEPRVASAPNAEIAPSAAPPIAERAPVLEQSPEPVVRVRIAADPPEAQLLLDGAPVANPYDAELAPRAGTRRVEARLDGHRTATRELAADQAQEARLVLEPEIVAARTVRRTIQPEVVPLAPQPSRPVRRSFQPVVNSDEL